MITDFDIAIIGSGFGGSLLAMAARRLGLSVLLVERGRHPRFAIGESTSPLTNIILEQLARRYDLPQLLPLTSYGPWQRKYPEIGCGLKRGFTYFKHSSGRAFQTRSDRANELLVTASPSDDVADTHWFRSDVDAFLVNEAVHMDLEFSDDTLSTLDSVGSDGALLTLTRHGVQTAVKCRFLIDASGPRGFLHRALSLPETTFESLPHTQALFSHFAGVHRTADMPDFHTEDARPYPQDAAALHHVFDEGWMWVLRFGNGVTSAGISITDPAAAQLNLQDGSGSWKRFLSRYPTIADQFADAEPLREFTSAPRLAFRSGEAAGDAWAMLPSAAAFVDPLFSTGFPLTLLGIERLGRILETSWGQPDMALKLRAYGDITLSDADWTAEFVGGCFAAMPCFTLFSHYSMYYFAAASFSEMARRVGRNDLSARFLLQHRPEFAAGLRTGAERLRNLSGSVTQAAIESLALEVAAAVRNVNIAGLCDPAKRNWYDIDWNDVIDNAQCLDHTPDQMRRLLADAEWSSYTAATI